MGRASSGTFAGGSIFTTNITGPTPGPLTSGSLDWIDLGVIPSGKKVWFGLGQYTSPDKAITFELRTNLVTKSAGTDADTLLLASCIASTRSGVVKSDYYKSNTLHIVSTLGSGIEHWWLKLKSKSGTQANYLYSINYTLE